VPSLLQLPSELEAQRNHVLGQPHRETDELEAAQRRQTKPSEAEDAFMSLGADAELDQVIFDGSSFGTATPAGGDEEADHLGLPGLLDANQMRELLLRSQVEQLGTCAANSTLWCRQHTIERASRTGGFRTSCAASAAVRRSLRPAPNSSGRVSKRCVD
jgi:hypothetical protein